jgi:hypothetical protein
VEEKDKKEKAKGSRAQTTKSVNTHVNIATIEEINNNNNIPISLYTATQPRQMVDSGAIHHITPHCSDFIYWTLAKGIVSVGGHVEIHQTGTRTVVI